MKIIRRTRITKRKCPDGETDRCLTSAADERPRTRRPTADASQVHDTTNTITLTNTTNTTNIKNIDNANSNYTNGNTTTTTTTTTTATTTNGQSSP